MTTGIIQTVEELKRLDVALLPARSEPERILMCPPDYFDVIDVKNVHMEANVGAVDKRKAREEWEYLKREFERAGHEVLIIEAVKELEDMVFAANQVLPGMGEDGRPYVLLSRMCHPSRQKEVPYYRAWFKRRGYRILELTEDAGFFEGQGDALWHPGRQLLWGGYGQRTSLRAYEQVSERLGVPVIALELPRASFYHLDTCFCVLRDDAVLIYPGAFTAEDREMIHQMFPLVIEASRTEAEQFFACNATALDGRTVIIQQGASETVSELGRAGFNVIEVETEEFMKSGGSVFCMKMMIY
jgi:N-dimethylarginine dimethylaminohydrolase